MTNVNQTMEAFTRSKGLWSSYPLNLLRTEIYSHGLTTYSNKLKQDQFFDSTYRSLFLWDLINCAAEFKASSNLDTVENLSTYVEKLPEDPHWRFIFLCSKSSRSPLGCNREQLQFLLTHHQVMATFLDFTFAFKGRERPLAQACFRSENYLDQDEPSFNLPQLGRSSTVVQHAFSLLSVEDNKERGKPWPLRQTALYHQFDIRHGKSTWIVLKGNVGMRRRIVKAVSEHKNTQPTALVSLASSFVATLHVHLIVLEWCAENWGEFIDDLDEKRSVKAVDAKIAPVAAMTSPDQIARCFSRRGTVGTSVSSPTTFYSRDSWSRGSTIPPSGPTARTTFGRSFSDLMKRGFNLKPLQTSDLSEEGETVGDQPDAADADDNQALAEQFDLKFSFEELQRLSLIGDELDQAIIAVEQNQEVLNQIGEQYKDVVDSAAFKANIDSQECNAGVSTFLGRLSRINRDLDMHLVRLRALSRAVEGDKVMFEAVLQWRSMKTSEHFAHSAKVSSDRMEEWTVKMHTIAVKTAQETVSMHVITIFTLIFLPGTFLATFFSSGVLNWNDQGLLDSDWVVRSSAMKLFMVICVPMMVIIITGWLLMYCIKITPQPDRGPECRGTDRTAENPMFQPDHFLQFADRIKEEKAKFKGRDISENEKPYIPRSVLESYWTPKNIAGVLQAFSPPLSFDVGIIRKRYLQTFSTLVYAQPEDVRFFEEFLKHSLDDKRLPLSHQPLEWPDDPLHRGLFSRFFPEQWMFFPLGFDSDQLSNRKLANEYVLPIHKPETIRQGDAALVRKITVNDEYNQLVEDIGVSKQRVLAVKTYHNGRFKRLYENEIRALTMLKNTQATNIVKYYGSFQQNGTYNIIMEYAEGGSLGDMLSGSRRPSTSEEIKQFWASLLDVLNGLEGIHQWMRRDEDGTEGNPIRGIHEDIKPDNILIFPRSSANPFDFVAKVADFGLFTNVRKSKTSSSEAMGLDNQGNQRYSAPECSNTTARKARGPHFITSKADMFSIGAVFSDCAAWVAGGTDLRASYLTQRLSYHASNKTFIHSGYDGCFHDGIAPLPVIGDFHQLIRQACHDDDHITPKILETLQSHVIIEKASNRLTPDQLWHKLAGLFRDSLPLTLPAFSLSGSEGGLALPRIESFPKSIEIGGTSARGDLEKGFTGSGEPFVLLAQASSTPGGDHVSDTADGSNSEDSGYNSSHISTRNDATAQGDGSGNNRKAAAISLLPLNIRGDAFTLDKLDRHRIATKEHQATDKLASEVVEYILENLRGRDQFFFIDDSLSMKQHAPVVEKAFTSLSWLAKRLDPDKVELSFSSRPRVVTRARKTKKLTRLVARQSYHRDPTMMEKSFGCLVDRVLVPRLPWRPFGFNLNPLARRQTTVYIFTDGAWGDDRDGACGVERPLERLMKTMRSRDLDRNQVSLHFVRFGSDERGKRHLEYLDEFGKGEKWDIVDVKHVSHPVPAIFLGPMSPPNDEKVYEDPIASS
ncbi:hypothetical protein F4778DRAFT_768378 [Xylariomycetidae sp. FL2044]|nr:hypothetical protein F4778DRAFT_768378 [Xylariomycetidae sp. FL2044]